MRRCPRTQRQPFYGHLAFEVGKVKVCGKWVPRELTTNPKKKKNLHFKMSSSLTLFNNNGLFLNQIVMCEENWILHDNQ